MDAIVVAVIALCGLLFGSFLNVVIYRVPRRESIVLPASHCPKCDHPLAAGDNIPVVSYLRQRGKCRYCGEPISIKYPVVEIATVLIALAGYLTYGLTPAFGSALFFLLVLFTVSAIDIEHKIIPNVIILPALAIGAALVILPALAKIGNFSLMAGQAHWPAPVIGFLIGGGSLFLLAVLWPSGMGGGDIKLAALMGLFLGPYVIIALFFGFVLGSIGGLTAMGLLGKSRKDQIPFGPYLAAGSFMTIYLGPPLARWYLALSGLG